MTPTEAITSLGIEDYRPRIYASESAGHLMDYVHLAECFDGAPVAFRPLFEECVGRAELTWGNPDTVLQCMPAMIAGRLRALVAEVEA